MVENKNGKLLEVQNLNTYFFTDDGVVIAVDGVDFVIMVTEPTPFGLYDLKLAVDVIRKIGLPFGVVINRSCENDTLIEDWAKEELEKDVEIDISK